MAATTICNLPGRPRVGAIRSSSFRRRLALRPRDDVKSSDPFALIGRKRVVEVVNLETRGMSTGFGPVNQARKGKRTFGRSASEQAGDGPDQAGRDRGFLEVIEVAHQVDRDERGEEEANGREAEQPDPEPAPFGCGFTGDDHGGAGRGGHALVGRPGRGHFAGNGLLEAVVFLFLLGEGRGGHCGGRVLVNVFFVDREDLGAAVAVFKVEITGRLELDGLVIGRIFIREGNVDLEIGVVEDVFFTLLRGGRGRCGQAGFGPRWGGLAVALGRFCWLGRLYRLGGFGRREDLKALISSSESGASSIESWCFRSSAPGP